MTIFTILIFASTISLLKSVIYTHPYYDSEYLTDPDFDLTDWYHRGGSLLLSDSNSMVSKRYCAPNNWLGLGEYWKAEDNFVERKIELLGPGNHAKIQLTFNIGAIGDFSQAPSQDDQLTLFADGKQVYSWYPKVSDNLPSTGCDSSANPSYYNGQKVVNVQFFHTGKFLTLLWGSRHQGYGLRNLKIETIYCDQGCEAIQDELLKYQLLTLELVGEQQSTALQFKADNWQINGQPIGSNIITQCSTTNYIDRASWLGGYNQFGAQDILSKTFPILQRHRKVQIEFQLLVGDYVQFPQDYLVIGVDSNLRQTINSDDGFSIHPAQCGSSQYSEKLKKFSLTFDHTASSLQLFFQSAINEKSKSQAWFAVKDLIIRYVSCNSTECPTNPPPSLKLVLQDLKGWYNSSELLRGRGWAFIRTVNDEQTDIFSYAENQVWLGKLGLMQAQTVFVKQVQIPFNHNKVRVSFDLLAIGPLQDQQQLSVSVVRQGISQEVYRFYPINILVWNYGLIKGRIPEAAHRIQKPSNNYFDIVHHITFEFDSDYKYIRLDFKSETGHSSSSSWAFQNLDVEAYQCPSCTLKLKAAADETTITSLNLKTAEKQNKNNNSKTLVNLLIVFLVLSVIVNIGVVFYIVQQRRKDTYKKNSLKNQIIQIESSTEQESCSKNSEKPFENKKIQSEKNI